MFRIIFLFMFLGCECAPLLPRYEARITDIPTSQGSNFYVPSIRYDGDISTGDVEVALALLEMAIKNKAQAVVFEINSDGGSLDAGFKLSKALEQSPVPVICVVDYKAISAAFFILQSCKVRIMTVRSTLMVHEPAIKEDGPRLSPTYWYNRELALKAMTTSVLEQSASRLKIPVEELRNRVYGGGQYWMDWKEALRIGAVDHVVKSADDVHKAYQDRLRL